MKLQTSVVSYPKRGPYGNGRFRGNTSGYLIKDLVETFKPKSVLDPKRLTNPTFKATIRRTLQEVAKPVTKGLWSFQ